MAINGKRNTNGLGRLKGDAEKRSNKIKILEIKVDMISFNNNVMISDRENGKNRNFAQERDAFLASIYFLSTSPAYRMHSLSLFTNKYSSLAINWENVF